MKTKNNYNITYIDMDGVLVDFETGYRRLTGYHPSYLNRRDRDIFGNEFLMGLDFHNMTEREFWAGLPLAKGATQLWEVVKNYNPVVLTAPSSNIESRLGKRDWIENHLSSSLDIKFRPTGRKHYEIKNLPHGVRRRSILIDDYSKNIIPWKINSGQAILHSSSEYNKTIDTLNEIHNG